MAMTQQAASAASGRFPYAATFKEPVIDIETIRRAEISRDPYTHMLVDNVLSADVVPALRAGFPNITKPGFLTVDEVEMRGKFKQLIDELESPELSEVMSQRMGIDLHPYPRLTTIRKISQAKDGRSHTDGTAKVMTLLVYMNDAWNDDGAGRLRVLYGPDGFEPYKLEVPPTMGTMFAFLRADNSWHGHPPFAGERRVVQVAWVKDEAELARKKKRNSMAQFFKGIFGR
ncbi:2OG-Fe(II) oxygenase superfamily protein [Rhizobiales bacterium GAS191]|nr:2OG-Fe(II) oxygenase superfamily protein [Rhizobiales bacterium GAS113]SEE95054.1 2OG-Fe(II) oxygenase superfamily protein [Rhizobiales bacterium GAS191]